MFFFLFFFFSLFQPFALLKAYTGGTVDDNDDENNTNGFGIGLMNIAQVLGQMLANLIYGGVASELGSAAGIAVGAGFALLGLPVVLALANPENQKTEVTE